MDEKYTNDLDKQDNKSFIKSSKEIDYPKIKLPTQDFKFGLYEIKNVPITLIEDLSKLVSVISYYDDFAIDFDDFGCVKYIYIRNFKSPLIQHIVDFVKKVLPKYKDIHILFNNISLMDTIMYKENGIIELVFLGKELPRNFIGNSLEILDASKLLFFPKNFQMQKLKRLYAPNLQKGLSLDQLQDDCYLYIQNHWFVKITDIKIDGVCINSKNKKKYIYIQGKVIRK